MVISETLFKNKQIPVNSSLFIFKRGENICMDTHYVYDEFDGTGGQGNNTNYHKYIKPMIESFGLVNEYYYMLLDDTPVWIDMTKRKKDIGMGEYYYSYNTLIGDPDEINVELLSKYAIAYFINTEEGKIELKEKYVVDPKKMTFSFLYQETLDNSTESFKVDFISKYHTERKTTSIRLNSMTEIPEYEPYYNDFRNRQTIIPENEKLKYFIEYLPTVIYPDNFGGPNEFVVTNPGRDTLAVFIPNRYETEITDPDMGAYKYVSNVDLFAEENKFFVFLNGILVDYTVIDTDPGFTDIVTGETRYKRIKIENCGQLLRRKRLSSFTADGTETTVSVHDDTINIVYWEGVKYLPVNRDEGFSIYNHKLNLFKERSAEDGGPVIMAVPSIFYYTDAANSETQPVKINTESCIVVRDGLILTPEVDFSIDNTRLMLKSELEVPALDKYLSEHFYDQDEHGVQIYDYNRYRNLITDKVDSYTRTKVLYLYSTDSSLPIIIDRDSDSIKVNDPLIGSVIVRDWDRNDLFIGGKTKMDLEYVTTEPDGEASLVEESEYYGQKRTVLSAVLNDTVISSIEDASLADSAESVSTAINLKEFEINLPESYLSKTIAKTRIAGGWSLERFLKILLMNKVSSESFKVENGSPDTKYCVMYLDGTKSKTYTQSVVKLKDVGDHEEVDVSADGNLFDVINASDIDTIYVMMSSETFGNDHFNGAHDIHTEPGYPDPNTDNRTRFRMLFCLLKTGEICSIIPNSSIVVEDDTCTVTFSPIIDFYEFKKYVGNFGVENGVVYAIVSGDDVDTVDDERVTDAFYIHKLRIYLTEIGGNVLSTMSPSNSDCKINTVTVNYDTFKTQIKTAIDSTDDYDVIFDVVRRSYYDELEDPFITKIRHNPINSFSYNGDEYYLFVMSNCQIVDKDLTDATKTTGYQLSLIVVIGSDGNVVDVKWLSFDGLFSSLSNISERLSYAISYFDIIKCGDGQSFYIFVDVPEIESKSTRFRRTSTGDVPLLSGARFRGGPSSVHETIIYCISFDGSSLNRDFVRPLINSLGIETYESILANGKDRMYVDKHTVNKRMIKQELFDFTAFQSGNEGLFQKYYGENLRLFEDRMSMIIDNCGSKSDPRLSGAFNNGDIASDIYGSVDKLKYNSISMCTSVDPMDMIIRVDMGDPDSTFFRMSPLTHLRKEMGKFICNNITLSRSDTSYFNRAMRRSNETDNQILVVGWYQEFKKFLTTGGNSTLALVGSSFKYKMNDDIGCDIVHITQYDVSDDDDEFKLINDAEHTITDREFVFSEASRSLVNTTGVQIMSDTEFEERFSKYKDETDDEFVYYRFDDIMGELTEDEMSNINQRVLLSMNFEANDRSLNERINSVKKYKIPFGMNADHFLELYEGGVYLVSSANPNHKVFLFETDMFDKCCDYSVFYDRLKAVTVNGVRRYILSDIGLMPGLDDVDVIRTHMRAASEQDTMLFVSSYHNGFKLVLIDPDNISQTDPTYGLGVERSIKDYDPFRNTKICRLKLFV